MFANSRLEINTAADLEVFINSVAEKNYSGRTAGHAQLQDSHKIKAHLLTPSSLSMPPNESRFITLKMTP